MPPRPEFTTQTQDGTFSFEVLGRPAPDSASFETRNQVSVRLGISQADGTVNATTVEVFTGDFVRFSLGLDLVVGGNWYPTPDVERGDPIWRRDALALSCSTGRLELVYQLTHYELSWFDQGCHAPHWCLRLSPSDLKRFQDGIDSLYHSREFASKAIPQVTPLASDATRQWLSDFKDTVVDDWYYLKLDALREQNWGAVMCLEHWVVDDVVRTQKLVEAIGGLVGETMLAYAFIDMGDPPQHAELPVSLDGIVGYLEPGHYRPIDNVLFTDAQGRFAWLVTHEEYMIFAGPPALVHAAFNGHLYECRLALRKRMLRDEVGYPEAANKAVIANQDRWIDRDRQYHALLMDFGTS